MAGNPNWTKGVSGNPGGKRRVSTETKRIAGDESPASVRRLCEIRDESNDPHAVIAACKLILAYGVGVPAKEIKKTIEHVRRHPREMTMEELERRLEETSH